MSAKIKVSERFVSVQGEGMYVGVPSVFLRTFGCNFECRGFGLPRGQKTDEPEIIASNIGQYATFEDLPLATYGCDSFASWHSAYKHLSPTLTVDVLIDQLTELLPKNSWRENGNEIHLVITGGEPLLGWQKAYPELLTKLFDRGLRHVTFETNGTKELTNDFVEFLFEDVTRFGRDYHNLTFSVSPKLPCSGEKWEDAIKPDIVKEYELVGNTYLKFVVATQDDVDDVDRAVEEYRKGGFGGPVYLMPVGGKAELYTLNATEVAKIALLKGYRYSPRLHINLFGNAWGT